jgi:hypothetical protein
VVGVNTTGGGHIPVDPDEVPPDDELLLDEELLEDDELLDDVLLPEDELLLVDELLLLASPPLDELLLAGSPLGDISPPQPASNAVLAINNVSGYLRCAIAASMSGGWFYILIKLHRNTGLVCRVRDHCNMHVFSEKSSPIRPSEEP